MTNYVICTDLDNMATFVGARSLGNLRADMPAGFAYCYDSVTDADAVARMMGLTDYMVGSLADFS